MAEKSLNHLIKGGVEGLRERKKRETRQRISDVATGMFLDRGFDSVRVSEVAEACGVSEKTVYNYFPTKESLLLDREEDIADALRAALGPNGTRTSPVDAFIDILDAELERYSEYWSEEGDADDFLEKMRRFADVVQETASLRSAYADMMTRLTRIAAEAISPSCAPTARKHPQKFAAGHAMTYCGQRGSLILGFGRLGPLHKPAATGINCCSLPKPPRKPQNRWSAP
jgi:AcrR family transcriptional regulator